MVSLRIDKVEALAERVIAAHREGSAGSFFPRDLQAVIGRVQIDLTMPIMLSVFSGWYGLR